LSIVFEDQEFFDDRLIVTLRAPCHLERTSDDLFETTIFHERVPDEVDPTWSVMVMVNTLGFRLVRLLNVPSEEFARSVHEIVECATTFASLRGRPLPPERRANIGIFREEIRKRGLLPFNYRTLYSSGGSNHKEHVMQSAEQFFNDARETMRILNF